MNNRLAFEIVCPHNHNQTVKFTKDEFETELKSGTLVFHCNTCDTNWPPSSEEIATFRKLAITVSVGFVDQGFGPPAIGRATKRRVCSEGRANRSKCFNYHAAN